MLKLAKYTERKLLRGGRSIEIRAICAADRTELLSALYRVVHSPSIAASSHPSAA